MNSSGRTRPRKRVWLRDDAWILQVATTVRLGALAGVIASLLGLPEGSSPGLDSQLSCVGATMAAAVACQQVIWKHQHPPHLRRVR